MGVKKEKAGLQATTHAISSFLCKEKIHASSVLLKGRWSVKSGQIRGGGGELVRVNH